MSLLRRRIWSAARMIRILGRAHQMVKGSTWYEVAKISRFDLGDHRSFSDRIIIGAYAVNRVVTSFSESCVLINTSAQLRVGTGTNCSMSIQGLENPGNIKKLGGDWIEGPILAHAGTHLHLALVASQPVKVRIYNYKFEYFLIITFYPITFYHNLGRQLHQNVASAGVSTSATRSMTPICPPSLAPSRSL